MAELKSQPRIEIDSASGELRVLVPITARVTKFYWRVLVARLVVFSVFSVLACACITIALIEFRHWGFATILALYAALFGVCVYYILRHPGLVMNFNPSATTIRVDGGGKLTIANEAYGIREFAAADVISVSAERCDFSRCGQMVLKYRRRGRRRRAAIAVYAEVQSLRQAAEAIARAMIPAS